MGIRLGENMVYRNYHCEKNDQCMDDECTALTAYVRISGKWTPIGYFGSDCKKFELLDLEKEKVEKEQDRITKEKMMKIRAEMRQVKQESRERLKTIKNEFNANRTFFNQQTREYQSNSK